MQNWLLNCSDTSSKNFEPFDPHRKSELYDLNLKFNDIYGSHLPITDNNTNVERNKNLYKSSNIDKPFHGTNEQQLRHNDVSTSNNLDEQTTDKLFIEDDVGKNNLIIFVKKYLI